MGFPQQLLFVTLLTHILNFITKLVQTFTIVFNLMYKLGQLWEQIHKKERQSVNI